MEEMEEQKQKFIIRIKCIKLEHKGIKDINPQVIVSEQSGQTWYEKGRTETLFKTCDPQFSQSIEINYQFSEQFNIKFDTYHCEGEKKHPIGTTIINIVSLLAAKDQIMCTDLTLSQRTVGRIVVIGEYLKYKNDYVLLHLRAQNLSVGSILWCFPKKPKNPKLRISRYVKDSQQLTTVFCSDSIEYNQEQSWPIIKLKASTLCNNDYETTLQIEVVDGENNNHVGTQKLSVSQMIDHASGKLRNLVNQSTKAITGQLEILSCQIKQIPTFEDYIKGGLQLNLMISIDFTESNIEATQQQSLHYFDQSGQKLSQYEKALRYVSEILIQYDNDKKVPLFGFGFVFRENQNGQTQHCFPLNRNLEDPEVNGLVGIFQYYREFVKTITFAGPTLFRPTLNEAMKMARGYKDAGSDKYVVLTILTDGIINDFDGTFEKIVDCCELPLSIIIIGIGTANFGEMEKLNNNELKEVDQLGRKATRDLVKFVDFKNFQNDSKRLAREVLQELPDQVVEYMQMIGKMPNKQQIQQIDESGDQYYRPQKIQRQSTLKRLLGEEDQQDPDNRTIQTKNAIINPQQFQQQYAQFNNQQNPFLQQEFENVNNPMLSDFPNQQRNPQLYESQFRQDQQERNQDQQQFNNNRQDQYLYQSQFNDAEQQQQQYQQLPTYENNGQFKK